MRITRPRHPLQGKSLPVLGGMRRHGEPELLLVLPDGSKSLIRADWTDAAQPGADDVVGVATLGSLTDLLRACKLVADLLGREPEDRDRLQGCHRARRTPVQPVQLSLIPDPLPAAIPDPSSAPPTPMVEQLPAAAVTTAITLLATVIAKATAAAPTGIEAGDE